MRELHITAIISSYNQPEWLEKSLWGWYAQKDSDFDIVIADDGSREETRDRIDMMREDTGMPIQHVWHEDKGHRKCRILNLATLEAKGDYLIFSDGDCIPCNDFVEVHRSFAAPGCYVTGGIFRLSGSASRAITREDIVGGIVFELRWLRTHGVPAGKGLLKLGRSRAMSRLLDTLSPTDKTWHGGNSSAWKEDVIAVNGHDERMRWGLQDREFGYRLVNYGIRPIQIRYTTCPLHLWHDRPYSTGSPSSDDVEITRETRHTGRMWTPHGIRKTVEPDRAEAAEARRD